MPLIWNGVARQAETVLLMVRGTRYGPMRLTPFSRRVSMASIWLMVEAPPEPATRPVRGLEICSALRPESLMACSIAR
ncbi:hypothetical protein FQZ97_463560 [compost metagenome]